MRRFHHTFNVTTCNAVLKALQDDTNGEGYVLVTKQRIADLVSETSTSNITYHAVTQYVTILEEAERLRTWCSRPVEGKRNSIRTLIQVVRKTRLTKQEFESIVEVNVEDQLKALRHQYTELQKQLKKGGK